MEHRTLGRDGARVTISRLSLGTATFGVRPEADQVDRLVGSALELGITCFDTANSYGNLAHFDRPGVPPAEQRESAEELLGRALRGRRDGVVIATKVGEPLAPDDRRPPMRIDLSRRHIFEQARRSLARLGVDHIDLYYAHHPDPATPLDETVSAFHDLIERGDITAWGVSNHSPAQLQAVLDAAARNGWHRPVVDQVRYHLLDRSVEPGLAEVGAALDVGIVAYGALGGGLLAGASSAGRRFVGDARWRGAAFDEAELNVARRLDALAAEWRVTAAQVALAWLFARPGVVGAIVGAGTPERLHEATAALDLRLEADQHAALDGVWTAYRKGQESEQFPRPS